MLCLQRFDTIALKKLVKEYCLIVSENQEHHRKPRSIHDDKIKIRILDN